MGVRRSWRVGAGCKPAASVLSRFESYRAHQTSVVLTGSTAVSKTAGPGSTPGRGANLWPSDGNLAYLPVLETPVSKTGVSRFDSEGCAPNRFYTIHIVFTGQK